MASSYINKQIGNYRLLAELGSGAFGNVYRAEHLYLKKHRMVAMKVMHTAHLDSEREQSSFLAEARFLEMVQHPYILPVVDVGIYDGFPYLVTEYAVNGSLRDRMQQLYPERVPVEAALHILTQVGQALQHAHEQNVIHRDLKPANILFNAEGGSLLADFGIATTLASASIKLVEEASGSAPYMAPEQFKGILSKEGDQYSFGCIAYELFTGQLPFTAPDPFSLGFKHLTEAPPSPKNYNPALPFHIEQAILKALSKERTERYPDMLAFIAALNPADDLSLTILPHRAISKETKPLAVVAVNQVASSTDVPAAEFIPLPIAMEGATGKTGATVLPIMETPPAELEAEDTTVLSTGTIGETSLAVAAKTTHSVNTDITIPVINTDSTILVGHTISSSQPISAFVGTLTSGEQPEKKRRRVPLLLLIASVLALLLLLIPGTVAAFYTFAYPATVVASITPLQKDVKSSFDIPVVLKNPDSSKNQVLGARLVSVTKTLTSTGYSSGIRHNPATVAYGTLTLENDSTKYSYYYVNNGQQLNANGITLYSLQYAQVYPNQWVTFSVRAASAGSAGNIKAGAFYYYYNDGYGGYKFYNTAAFSGGKDASNDTLVQQGDIDAVANPLVAPLQQNAMVSLRREVQNKEQFVVAPQCTSNIAHDRNAGDIASSFTVTVTNTCLGEVYTSLAAQVKAVDLLKSQVSANLDPNYQLINKVTTVVSRVKLIDAKHGILLLTIQTEGIWAFHFSDAQKHDLARFISGRSVQEAKDFLAQQTGVSTVTVTISGTFWLWHNVPTNLNNITIKINVANAPKLH